VARTIVMAVIGGLLLCAGALVLLPAVVAMPRTENPPPGAAPPGTGPITSACFSSDGKWLLTADWLCNVELRSADGQKLIWSVRATEGYEKRFQRTDPPRQYGALAVTFAADGKRVFVAWAAGVAEIDREKGKVLRTTKFPTLVSNHGGFTPAMLVFLPASDECVYFGEDDHLIRFDFKANKRHDKFDLKIPDLAYLYVVLRTDGKHVLAYTLGGYLSEWELATGELSRLWATEKVACNEAGYTPNGEGIWMWRDTVEVLDRVSKKPVELPGKLAKYEGSVWFSPDGKHALGLPEIRRNQEDKLEVLRVSDGKILHRVSSQGLFHYRYPTTHPEDSWWVTKSGLVVFHPDNKTVLLSSGDAFTTKLGYWDLTTGKHIRTVRLDE
jgi:WD40 repeat protein